MKQYTYALQFWEQLKKIQFNQYGEDHEVLIYTYKNLGICYLALGIPEKAEEFYLKALNIMNALEAVNPIDNPELLKEDREQLAAIYFNLYLSSISNEDREKAKEYNLKAMIYNQMIYGERSLQVSNNHFIHSQLEMKTGNMESSKTWMIKALSLFDEPFESKDKGKSEISLIKLRYIVALSNIYYISGEYPAAE
jgi:tetratricopeptide (TPR) repeat protein